jgi:hypothetical protein
MGTQFFDHRLTARHRKGQTALEYSHEGLSGQGRHALDGQCCGNRHARAYARVHPSTACTEPATSGCTLPLCYVRRPSAGAE